MSAPESLKQLYESWRKLTHNETEAIEAAAWDRLSECQQAKASLQPLIISASERHWSGTNPFGRDDDPEKLRGVLQELIALETRNSELLATRIHETRQERAGIEEVARNLNRVQRSYGTPQHAAWQAYS